MGDYKAIVGALVLPPAGPLLLALLGLLMVRFTRRLGWLLVLLSVAGLWALSTHAVALALYRALLPGVPVADAAELRRAQVQAIVVLGGGVIPHAEEYGTPQPSAVSLRRLRYGVRLARLTGLPLAFSGGLGWSGRGVASEAEAARLAARQDFGTDIRWIDSRSRDTHENALNMAALLRQSGIRRIALVSDAWHLPRAALEFRMQGLQVLPAPTGLLTPVNRPLLEWLPSPGGLLASQAVLREWLALQVALHGPS